MALSAELCFRVDLGTVNSAGGPIPDGVAPWNSIEDCLTQNSQGYAKTGLFF